MQELIDEALQLDKEIKEKEQMLKLMKTKIEREMVEKGLKEIMGTTGKVVFITQNRKKVNEAELFIKFGITKEDKEAFTEINTIEFIKMIENK